MKHSDEVALVSRQAPFPEPLSGFITEKSVEEAVFQRARYKLDIDDKVIQAGLYGILPLYITQRDGIEGIEHAGRIMIDF
jgi:hypothetical protein